MNKAVYTQNGMCVGIYIYIYIHTQNPSFSHLYGHNDWKVNWDSLSVKNTFNFSC